MAYSKVLIVLLLTLLLQACASPKMAQEVQSGKSSFSNGDYVTAYHALLPAAVAGNAEAQYAVGYLYYYGYGVQQDSVTGLFWMQKAADQHYLPAQNALVLIAEKNSMKPTVSSEGSSPQVKAVKTSSADNTINPSVSEPSQGLVAHVKTHLKKNSLAQDEVLQSLPATNNQSRQPVSAKYVLQLAGDYTIGNMQGLQRALKSSLKTYLWQTQHKGNAWFILTVGEYNSLSAAKAAQKALPLKLARLNPWIRPVANMQKR